MLPEQKRICLNGSKIKNPQNAIVEANKRNNILSICPLNTVTFAHQKCNIRGYKLNQAMEQKRNIAVKHPGRDKKKMIMWTGSNDIERVTNAHSWPFAVRHRDGLMQATTTMPLT